MLKALILENKAFIFKFVVAFIGIIITFYLTIGPYKLVAPSSTNTETVGIVYKINRVTGKTWLIYAGKSCVVKPEVVMMKVNIPEYNATITVPDNMSAEEVQKLADEQFGGATSPNHSTPK